MSPPVDQSHIEVARIAAQTAVQEFVAGPAFKSALQEGINSALEKLGVNASTPEAREEFRLDMVHLRTWREFMQFAKKKGIGTTITWIVTAGLAALAAGIVMNFHR